MEPGAIKGQREPEARQIAASPEGARTHRPLPAVWALLRQSL
jgi:hypothetical protein